MRDFGPIMAASSGSMLHQAPHAFNNMVTGHQGAQQFSTGNAFFQHKSPPQYTPSYTDLQPMQVAYHHTQAQSGYNGGRMVCHPSMAFPMYAEPQKIPSPPNVDMQYSEGHHQPAPLPPVSPPPQRERFSYTRYQLELLNHIYIKVRYPNSMQKQLIAKRVGITREQVKIWFQNRRRKDVVKPKSRHNEPEDHGPSMVPQNVKTSVITELMRHEANGAKGKHKKGGKPYQVEVAQRRSSSGKKSSAAPNVTAPPSGYDMVSSSTSFSSNGSPQSNTQNDSRDSLPGLLNMSNSSGFQPVTPPSDSSSDGDALVIDSSPQDHTPLDQSLQQQHHNQFCSELSPRSNADSGASSQSSEPSIRSSMDLLEDRTLYIPMSHGLDMAGPPNAVAPGSSLTPRGMEELRNKIKADSEPPRLEIPPNKVAPPSEPIPTLSSSTTSPTSQSLTVNIPNELLQGSTGSQQLSSYASPEGNSLQWHQPPRPTSNEYTQYRRDVKPNVSSGTDQFPGLLPYDQKAINMERVFPYPLVAESPMMLSSMPTYSDSYQSNLRTGTTQGNSTAPGAYGRDPYHPLMISSFQNPYYTNQDPASWSRTAYPQQVHPY